MRILQKSKIYNKSSKNKLQGYEFCIAFLYVFNELLIYIFIWDLKKFLKNILSYVINQVIKLLNIHLSRFYIVLGFPLIKKFFI